LPFLLLAIKLSITAELEGFLIPIHTFLYFSVKIIGSSEKNFRKKMKKAIGREETDYHVTDRRNMFNK